MLWINMASLHRIMHVTMNILKVSNSMEMELIIIKKNISFEVGLHGLRGRHRYGDFCCLA